MYGPHGYAGIQPWHHSLLRHLDSKETPAVKVDVCHRDPPNNTGDLMGGYIRIHHRPTVGKPNW